MTLTGHNHRIRDLAIHPEDKFLITVSRDKTVRLWNAIRWRPGDGKPLD